MIVVKTIKKEFELALENATVKKNTHSKHAYAFALKVLNSVNDDVVLNVRQTQNAFNIGDVVESVLKHHLNETASYSNKGQKDLNKRSYHEIKTFASANRYPNGLKKPEGFLAINKNGVFYIKKELVEQYWDTFRYDKKNELYQPTASTVNAIIEMHGVNKHYYSELLGL